MKPIHAVVIRRSNEENTVAIVRAQVNEDFGANEDNAADAVTVLWGRIQIAVTDWFHETDDGKAVIRSNDYDFNVGDLREWCSDSSLTPFLKHQGIHDLSIETHSDTTGHCWDFDDAVFDDMQIKAATEK